MNKKCFLIESSKDNRGSLVAWWRPYMAGVTTDIAKAGTFTEIEAEKVCKARKDMIAWPIQSVLRGDAGQLGRVAMRGVFN